MRLIIAAVACSILIGCPSEGQQNLEETAHAKRLCEERGLHLSQIEYSTDGSPHLVDCRP